MRACFNGISFVILRSAYDSLLSSVNSLEWRGIFFELTIRRLILLKLIKNNSNYKYSLTYYFDSIPSYSHLNKLIHPFKRNFLPNKIFYIGDSNPLWTYWFQYFCFTRYISSSHFHRFSFSYKSGGKKLACHLNI